MCCLSDTPVASRALVESVGGSTVSCGISNWTSSTFTRRFLAADARSTQSLPRIQQRLGTLLPMQMRWLWPACAIVLVAAACRGSDGDPPMAAAPVLTSLAPLPTSASQSPPMSSPTTSTTPTTTTTTTTTLPPIVLGFAGDTSFTHSLHQFDPLGEVTELLAAPDLMLVNLETTIAEPNVGTAKNKRFTFKSPPGSVGILTAAGIDVVQLANNHTRDYGNPALARTLELLDEGGLSHVGAGPDVVAAHLPQVFLVNGWKVGVVAFSRVPCGWSSSGENTRPEVAWTCDPFVADTLAAVELAAETSDVVVVMVHWGVELDHCPQPYQRELATMWQQSGADLIIGGHPHVLQGVERIGDAWLVNSTGNFAFPSARGPSASTAIFEFTVTTEDTTLEVTPVAIRAGRPHPADDDTTARILDNLTSYSFGWAFNDDGAAESTSTAARCGAIPAPLPPPQGPNDLNSGLE